MRKVQLFIAILLLSSLGFAQEENALYLEFAFMQVDDEMNSAYQETEAFWEKIHEQRVKNGDIIGWDLWSMHPIGTKQGARYLTVTLFNDPVKMMGGGDFMKAVKGAYPDMTDEEIDAKMAHTSKSRDLTHQVFFQQVNTVNDSYEMPLGTIAVMNFMKAKPGKAWDYEKMEDEIYKPMHQKRADAGGLEMWGILRNMQWYATDIYATHVAVDMYSSWDQFYNGADGSDGTPLTDEQQQAIDEGLATRDLRSMRIGILVKKVR